MSVVSYQDVGLHRSFSVSETVETLCVTTVVSVETQVVVEALLAKHGDLSAQDQSGATPSGAPSGDGW